MRACLRWSMRVAVVFVLGVGGAVVAATPSFAKPDLSPIVISTMAPDTGPEAVPEPLAGAEAAAAAINKAGGIKGHPIKIDGCDENGGDQDPSIITACARSAISEHAVADAGSDGDTQASVTLLNQANIPMVGENVLSEFDLTSPNEFPFNAGVLTSLAGMADVLVTAKAVPVKATTFAGPDGASVGPAISAALATSHQKLAGPVVGVNPTGGDFTPEVAQLQEGGTKGIVFATLPSQFLLMINELKQAGYTGKVALNADEVNATVLKQLKQYGNDLILVAGSYLPVSDTSNPAVATFDKQMAAIGKQSLEDGYSENAWAAVNLVAKAAKKASTLDAAGLNQALSAMTTYNPGVGPTVNFAKPLSIIPGLSRIFSASYVSEIVKNGKLTLYSPGFHQEGAA
jgi:ABC-type branched-subunit amino acid transport system substrate-binding protein